MGEVTKQELIKYFSSLDMSVLQRLKKYSEYIIIPEEDLATNVTMAQMVDKAHSLADSLFPEWTDRSKADFGEFLVELFALFSEKDFWYINAFANESLIHKMHSYSNAYAKASSMGFYPSTFSGAKASFAVTFSSGSSAHYDVGDLVVMVGGFRFTNTTAFNVDASAGDTTKELILSEGNYMNENIPFTGYSVMIAQGNIDISSIKVAIDNVLYSRVSNFGFSEPSSTHFMVLPEENGSCAIFFGANGLGVSPPIGKNINVQFRKCGGSYGNIAKQDSTSVSSSLSSRSVKSAVMSTDATGGTNADSLEYIREMAPTYFYTKMAAINESVAEEILNRYPFVFKSKVSIVGNVVSYRVIPNSGNSEPSAADKIYMESNFEPCLMAGYEGVYAQNTYIDLLTLQEADSIVVEATVAPGYDMESIKNSIKHLMEDYTNPLVLAEYGVGFNKNAVDIYLRTFISGLQKCNFKKVIGGVEFLMEDKDIISTAIFSKIDITKISIRTYVY